MSVGGQAAGDYYRHGLVASVPPLSATATSPARLECLGAVGAFRIHSVSGALTKRITSVTFNGVDSESADAVGKMQFLVEVSARRRRFVRPP